MEAFATLCTSAFGPPVAELVAVPLGRRGRTEFSGGAAVPCLHFGASAAACTLLRQQRKRGRSKLHAVSSNDENSRRAIVEDGMTEYDRLLFRDLVLQQATQGRILSPVESFLFHLRTSRGYVACRGLLKRLRTSFHSGFWPRRKKVSTTKTSNSLMDTSLPEEGHSAQEEKSPSRVAMLGTRDASFNHQKEIEKLSEARASGGDHIYTSGSVGTNAAVIRGAMKAGRPDMLKVILPQSLSRQDLESQTLLRTCIDAGVEVVELSYDDLSLEDAARRCNTDILEQVDKLVAFVSLVPSESETYMSLIEEAKEQGVSETTFYLN